MSQTSTSQDREEVPAATECPDCDGAGTVEHYVVGLGLTDARCPNEACDDGLIR